MGMGGFVVCVCVVLLLLLLLAACKETLRRRVLSQSNNY